MSLLPAASASAASRPLLQLELVEPRAQHGVGLRAVAVLRAVGLAGDDDAGRQVGQPDRAVGLVDVLAAGAGGAVGVDAQVLVQDLDLDRLVDHRVDPDAGEARVAARLAVERRDPHQAVHAALGLEPAVGVGAEDLERRRLDARPPRPGSPRSIPACSRAPRPSGCTCAAASPPSPATWCRRRRRGSRESSRWRRPRRRAGSRSAGGRAAPAARRARSRPRPASRRRPPPRPARRAPRRPRAPARGARWRSTASASRVRSRITFWARSESFQSSGFSASAFSSSSRRTASSQSKMPPQQGQRLLDLLGHVGDLGAHQDLRQPICGSAGGAGRRLARLPAAGKAARALGRAGAQYSPPVFGRARRRAAAPRRCRRPRRSRCAAG